MSQNIDHTQNWTKSSAPPISSLTETVPAASALPCKELNAHRFLGLSQSTPDTRGCGESATLGKYDGLADVGVTRSRRTPGNLQGTDVRHLSKGATTPPYSAAFKQKNDVSEDGKQSSETSQRGD